MSMYKHQYFDDVPYRLSHRNLCEFWALGQAGEMPLPQGQRGETHRSIYLCFLTRFVGGSVFQEGCVFCSPQPCSPENCPMDTRKIRKKSDEKWDPRRAIFRKNHEESQFLWGFHWYFQAFGALLRSLGLMRRCVTSMCALAAIPAGIPLILSFFCAMFVHYVPSGNLT